MTRRKYTPEMKMQIVKEAIETGNGSIVARRHDISSSPVNRWVRTYKKYGTLIRKKDSCKQTEVTILHKNTKQ